MSKTLCIYCTRTGITAKIAKQIAEETDAELMEITNGKDYHGAFGYFRAAVLGLRKKLPRLMPATPALPLSEYERIYVAAPIWCERISPIARAYLIEHRAELPQDIRVVATHMSDLPYQKPIALLAAAIDRKEMKTCSVQTRDHDWTAEIAAFVQE